MNPAKQVKTTATTALAAMIMAAVLSGCATTSRSFQTNISKGAEALSVGQLDSADLHIKAAAAEANTYEQKRQVQSLQQLSSGARAMMDGNVSTARQHWAAIKDPRLNLKVRQQAKQVLNVDVPAYVPTENENEVQ